MNLKGVMRSLQLMDLQVTAAKADQVGTEACYRHETQPHQLEPRYYRDLSASRTRRSPS